MSSSLSSQLSDLSKTKTVHLPARVIKHLGWADSPDAIRESIYRTMLFVRTPMSLNEVEDACETPPGHVKGHIKELMKQGRVRPARDKFIAVAE